MFLYFVVQTCTKHAEDTKLSPGLEPDSAAACSAVPPIQRKIPQRHADKFPQHAARTLTGVTALHTVHVDCPLFLSLESQPTTDKRGLFIWRIFSQIYLADFFK